MFLCLLTCLFNSCEKVELVCLGVGFLLIPAAPSVVLVRPAVLQAVALKYS